MRLWLDDVRPPPDASWTWVRTNSEAIEHLETGAVIECSLDHDLGLHDIEVPEFPDDDWDLFMEIVHMMRPQDGETGLDLVDWMIEQECVPARVTIHSWNSNGAARMAARLANAGYDCYLAPFRPSVR
jgi:Cyclic-phosphate processing Receiver domain